MDTEMPSPSSNPKALSKPPWDDKTTFRETDIVNTTYLLVTIAQKVEGRKDIKVFDIFKAKVYIDGLVGSYKGQVRRKYKYHIHTRGPLVALPEPIYHKNSYAFFF
jgi:hypothetical protein